MARRGKLTITGENAQLETTTPLGLLVFRTTGIRYGEKNYGEFLYSGEVEYQINKVRYTVGTNRSLIKTIDLGQLRPSVSEEIEQLSFELEMLRAARV